MVLQIVIPHRETSGKKKSGLFTKAGFRMICGLRTRFSDDSSSISVYYHQSWML